MPNHYGDKKSGEVPKGSHRMPDGSIMKGDKHPKPKKTGKAVPFFYLGDQKKSEKLLDKKNKDKIENAFRNEMEELGYL